MWVIASDELTATIDPDGAEMVSLRDRDGVEYVWQAGPEWPRHAPILFPIVGKLKNDTLWHEGVAHRMGQHGFARDSRFQWAEKSAAGCRLVLEHDPRTLSMYPFPFRLEVGYAVAAARLESRIRIHNTGDTLLPASVGAHPAFRWPRSEDHRKDEYSLIFERAEHGRARYVENGYLCPGDREWPIRDRSLALGDHLFDRDALIIENPRSSSVSLIGPDGPALEVAWAGASHLGLWSKPGADFVCIEPWNGIADPVDWNGPFLEKPGIMRIEPGGFREFVYSIGINR